MLLGALCTTLSAAGQDTTVEPSAPGDPSLLVPAAEVVGDGKLRALLSFAYTDDPYRVVLPSQERDSVVSSRSQLALGVGYAHRHRWLVALSMPVVLAQSGEAALTGSTLERASGGPSAGDVRLRGRALLFGTPRRELALSLDGSLWAPTGSAGAYASDEQLRAGASLVAGGRRSRYVWSLEAGGRTRREQIVEGIVPYRVGHELILGAAVQMAVDWSGRWHAGSELRLHSAVSNGASLFDRRSTHGAWLATWSWRVDGSPLVATLGLGPGIGEAPGSGAWHALVRLAWAPFEDPAPPDDDDDGVADASDACPTLPGTPSGDPLMHGCPELPKDRDGDAIPDALDACPSAAGLPNTQPRLHGCPKPPAPPEAPPPPSPPEPPAKAELSAERITINQQILFETGTANLRAESTEILSRVAEILQQHPDLELVEIQGHTDDTGGTELNRRLSQDRARAVLDWLVRHGVGPERLTARGFGAEVPLADNTTDDGRARNRRVEFHVLRRSSQAPEPDVPEVAP